MNPAELTDYELGGLLHLRLGHHRDLGDAEDMSVEHWLATGMLVVTDEDDEPVEEVEVVQAHFVRCPLGQPGLAMLLDAIDGDLAAVGAVVLDFDSGDPAGAAAELGGIGSHFLIMDSVVCEERFRGRQIGRWIAGEAIDALSPGVEFVAAFAAPMDDSRGAMRARAKAKLADVWASIGFTEAEDDVLVLNPGLTSTSDLLEGLRRRFGVATG